MGSGLCYISAKVESSVLPLLKAWFCSMKVAFLFVFKRVTFLCFNYALATLQLTSNLKCAKSEHTDL